MTTLVQYQSLQSYDHLSKYASSENMDKVVQSVTKATKRLSQISTNTTNSNKKRKAQNRIGPWKLGRTLGRGSTGRVRLAKNVETGQLAAVKIVPKSNFKKLENPKYKRDSGQKDHLPYGIEREIIIMKLISHPNIMGLYDVWENKNDLYLILEYIEGGELFDYLIKRGKLQEFEAVSYFKQIIQGISYLHQLNICHRDLKPENLLLDFNKNIKIADFGMAALEMREKLLETSCGSPHYASPEIVAGKTYHGAPSDIWSCGIILFALLTGHLPFDDENIRKLLLKVQNGKYIMPPDLSWEAKDLISKMLQVKPENRISIDSILSHPLLTKYPEPASVNKKNKEFDVRFSNMRPIESEEKIDKELLKNLTVLFHNCNEQMIIKKLLSPEKHAEKLFYYLLMKYRNEHACHLNYSEEEADLTGSESRLHIPRSTSIVKTTTIDKSTGEKQTTIKKIPHSVSMQSNKSRSGMRRDKVLLNITNIPSSRNFKASTSFNRNKARMSTINRISSNNSSKSLKKTSTSGSAHETQPKLKRKLTGLLDLNNLEATNDGSSNDEVKPTPLDQENKENPVPKVPAPILNSKKLGNNVKTSGTTRTLSSLINSNHPEVKQQKRTFKNTAKDKTLLNFELVCQELFDKPTESKHEEHRSKSSNNSKINRPVFDAKKHERELADKVRKQNDEREKNYRLVDAELEKQRLEEKENERKRQSKLLQEKQKKALERLNSHIILNKTRDEKARVATEPVKSSLDPRVNTLMRAKSLATSDTRENVYFNNNKNASKVLQKLGIEFTHPPGSKLSPNLKTSSSRNLSMFLNDDFASKKSGLTIQDFNKSSKLFSDVASIKENPYNNNNNSSLTINRERTDINDMESIAEDLINTEFKDVFSNKRASLIPNPRFSRFSLGGFLNGKKYDEADLTIMKGITSSGTVKKTKADSTATRKLDTRKGTGVMEKLADSSTLGLGINVNDSKNTTNPYNSDDSNFISVEISESIGDITNNVALQDDAISLIQEENDESTLDGRDYRDDSRMFSFDKNQSKTILSDISNFDVISSRTADIGKLNTARPSLVDSKDTLLINSTANDSLATVYKNYEDLYGDSYYSSTSNYKNSTGNRDSNSKYPIEHKSYFDDSNLHVLDNSSIIEDTIDQKDTISELVNSNGNRIDRSNINSIQNSVAKDTILDDKQEDIYLISKQSFARESTRVFSETAISKINERSKIMTSAQNLKPDTPQVNNEDSVSRNCSLEPKREAPKPPSLEAKNGHNRFSRLSMASRYSKIEPNHPKKKNWFQKLFDSFGTQKDYSQTVNKNLKVITANLSSIDLMRIVKNQLELKMIDGTLKRVEIDDEFGLITGEIPSNLLQASKKLIFRIEIIDSIDKSSLQLMKLKGNSKSFKKLIDIVQCIVAQEEKSNTQRKSTSYAFSGYQKK